MPKSVGYPPNLVAHKGPKQSTPATPDQRDTLRFCMNAVKLWANVTQTARHKFKRDYEYAEGNGKQWAQQDRIELAKQRRPALESNEVYPQVELVCGIQRSIKIEYAAMPRGLEDKRISEVVNASLKATGEYVRLPRKNAHVFDDGTICGLGVWKILHNIQDAKDILWGDITVDRIHPCSYIWDPWATIDEGFQDGAFMGDAAWVHQDEFRKQNPEFTFLANPGEWLEQAGNWVGDSTLLGLGDSLKNELYNRETGMIRVLTIWRKVPTTISLLVNMDTGQVTEVESKDKGQEALAKIATQFGEESIQNYGVIQQGETTSIMDQQTGMAENYANPESAQARLDQLAEASGMQVYEKMKVITREARVPHWVEMVWGQIVQEGKTPYNDRKYPYVPYVSRMFQDDPDSIMGIVRNLWDPQDEINKRSSNLLGHLNSSTHSGWLNKKGQGASTDELKRMGSTPGVVVEYSAVAPQQIKPVEISQGHFELAQNASTKILRISGINAEMIGETTQKTVSGRAINARQEGGQTILKPRLMNFDEACLDVAQLLLSRIQQYYPPAKLKRIIGLAELAGPLMPGMPTVFADPVTGMPVGDDQIMEMLVNITNLNFDLSLKQSPADPTVRQEAFERSIQMVELFMKTGRIPGPNTLQALTDQAELPSRLAEGMKRDAMMPPMAPPQKTGGGSVSDKMRQENGGHDGNGGPGPGGV